MHDDMRQTSVRTAACPKPPSLGTDIDDESCDMAGHGNMTPLFASMHTALAVRMKNLWN